VPWIVGGAVASLGVVFGFVAMSKKSDHSDQLAGGSGSAVVAPVVVADAAVVVADAAVPVDARPTKPIVVEKKQPLKTPVDAGAQVVEQRPKHRVTLNTSPQWSWFTVDNDATKYQTPGTIELTAGTHTIHFSGNEYFPADKSITIEVGDKDLMKAVKLDN
jgi:hypothetical protein